METTSSYTARMANVTNDVAHCLRLTQRLYTDVVRYLVNIANKNWEQIIKGDASDLKRRTRLERLVHRTKANPEPEYADFDETFKRYPALYRRSAQTTAIGIVSSYRSNLANWETSGRKGAAPRLPRSYKHQNVPLYAKGCYDLFEKPLTDEDKHLWTIHIRLFDGTSWEWFDVALKNKDVRYFQRHLQDMVRKCPTLVHKHGRWSLRFAFTCTRELCDTEKDKLKVCAVDLGVNAAATCSIMGMDGTVFERRFVRFPDDEARLCSALERIRQAQSSGARRLKRMWGKANRLNEELSRKTVLAIIRFATEHDAKVIVCEHLDMSGKIRGSRRMRLSVWRCRDILRRLEHRAHAARLRFATVCAWNTSRLAFDGSGYVERGDKISDEIVRAKLENKHGKVAYDLCLFKNGKIYNCDLNASYNIGARYFLRLLERNLPKGTLETITAECPQVVKRTQATLSTLWYAMARLEAVCV